MVNKKLTASRAPRFRAPSNPCTVSAISVRIEAFLSLPLSLSFARPLIQIYPNLRTYSASSNFVQIARGLGITTLSCLTTEAATTMAMMEETLSA